MFLQIKVSRLLFSLSKKKYRGEYWISWSIWFEREIRLQNWGVRIGMN